MRGHIVKRGKDSYSIVLSLGADPVTGKRKRQWVSVKGDSKTAQKRLTERFYGSWIPAASFGLTGPPSQTTLNNG